MAINPATGQAYVTVNNPVIQGVTPGTVGTPQNTPVKANGSTFVKPDGTVISTPQITSIPSTPNVQPSTAPSSSTVVSNANVLENTIPGLNAQANSLTTADPTTLTPSGTGNASAPNTDYGSLYGTAYNSLPDETQDPVYQQEMSLINSLQQNGDDTTSAYVNSIQQNYANLLTQQNQQNAATTSQVNNALLLGGSSRYAPVSSAGILDAKTRSDLQNVSDLQDQENQKIAEVKQAQNAQDYQLLQQKLGELDKIRSDKQTQAKTIADNMYQQNQTAAATQAQTQTDNAIADLVTSGVTDTGSIIDALQQQGIPATADQVSKTLQTIATTAGSGSIDKLTGDVKNFYLLKGIQGGLPADILSLPPDQQLAAYIQKIHAATKGVISNTGSSSTGGTDTLGGGAGGVNVSPGGAAPVGSDPNNPSGNTAFLSTLSGDLPTLVQGLADYSINPSAIPTKQFKGASGYTQAQLIALAKQYDPTYDSKQYATRQAMQKNVASGTYSNTITSANTLIGHLAELQKAADALPGNVKGRPIGVLNSVADTLSNWVGNASVNNFNIAADAVASEAAAVYKGGSPTGSEIKDWRAKLSPDMTGAQLKGAINQIVALMGGKLGTISTQYKQVMGKPAGYQILTQPSIAILKSIGIDPSTVDPTYDQSTTIGGSSPSELLNFAASGNSNAYDPNEWSTAP